MIGWHWTSEANWLAIQRAGHMREYLINPKNAPDKAYIDDILGTPAGVYVFPDGPLDDFDETGCVYFQAIEKKSFRVVLLNIAYETTDIRTPGRTLDSVALTHNGSFGEDLHWPYHLGKPMLILRGPISLDRITLVRTYDITDVVRYAHEAAHEAHKEAPSDADLATREEPLRVMPLST